MRVLSIAWKDIRQTYRGKAFLVLILVAPLLLAFVLGAAFGSGDNFSISAVRTIVVDLDKADETTGFDGGEIFDAALTDPQMADLLEVTELTDPKTARTMVDDGEVAVAVIVPAGLSDSLVDSGNGNAALSQPKVPAVQVEVYSDPTLTVGPGIVTSIVESVTESLNGARAAAATAVRLGLSRGITDPQVLGQMAAGSFQDFSAKTFTEVPVTLQGRTPLLGEAETQKQPNVASQVLVGMMLFFMLFGASIPARGILDEHVQGTLPRLFTTPTPRSLILAGKYLGVFAVVLVQMVVLVLAGWLLLGADWGSPGPVIVLILSSCLVAASLGLVTVSFAKTQAQAGAVSSAIFVFLALISGNFTGGVTSSGVYGTVKKVSPLGWLMEGWGDSLYGGSWGGIALPVLVALAFALAFFGIATFFFSRRYA